MKSYFVLYYRLRKYEDYTARRLQEIGQLSDEELKELEEGYREESKTQAMYALNLDPNDPWDRKLFKSKMHTLATGVNDE